MSNSPRALRRFLWFGGMVLAVGLLGVAWKAEPTWPLFSGSQTAVDRATNSNRIVPRNGDRVFLEAPANDDLTEILDGQRVTSRPGTARVSEAFRSEGLSDELTGSGRRGIPASSAGFEVESSPGATSRPRRGIAARDDIVFEDVPHRTTILAQAPELQAEPATPATTAEPQPVTPPARSEPALLDAPLLIAAKTAKDATLVELSAIEEIYKANDYETALREYSKWYWKKPETRDALQKRMDELATKVYLAPQPHVMEPYVVQPGDLLQSIARKYKVTWEYLAKLNKTDPKKIRPGQKLKVVEGPFAAVISTSQYRLYIHVNGAYVKSFRVGLGKDNSTPTGSFTVKDKLVNPTYYGPDGVIKADDPKNPLGERWIDIGNSYGLHGTIEPDSIGKNESRGCIRLLNADVEEVYDFLTVGSPVLIQK